jgi:hypothetical protein
MADNVVANLGEGGATFATDDIGGVQLPPTPHGDYAEQVLDGQQRLTSLYAAVKGLMLERFDGRKDDFAQICVDLDADTDTDHLNYNHQPQQQQ